MLHHNKIPVGEIILRVFYSARDNAFALLRLSLPVIIIGLLSTIYYEIFEPETMLYADFTLRGLALIVLNIAAYAMAIIGIHRFFILPPDIVASTPTFRWTSRESGWLIWSIAFSFWLILLTVIPSCVALSSVQWEMNDPEQPVAMVENFGWLLGLFLGYFIARWSLNISVDCN